MTEEKAPTATALSRGYKPFEERSEFAQWLLTQMGERSFEQLAQEMAERGHHHGADYYRAMASDNKKAGQRIKRALQEHFASAPPSVTRGADGDLASAIRELTEELRASREERKTMRDDIDGLRNLVGSLAAQLQLEQELTARLARHVQLDSAGSGR